MEEFFKVVDWLYSIGSQFGVNHVIVRTRIYWLDTASDREALYELYKKTVEEVAQ